MKRVKTLSAKPVLFSAIKSVLCIFLMVYGLIGQAVAEPLLWRVQDPQTNAKIYLFGSIHFGTESLYPLPSYVIDAYSESDALAVELDISSISAPEAGRVLQAVGRLPNEGKIRPRLKAEAWQSLNRVCRALELPIESLEYFQPWLVAVQLTAAQIRRNGYSEGYGVDRHFLTLAKHPLAPKPVLQLETFEQQMSLFGGLSDDQQSLFLEQTLVELESAPDMLRAVIDAWVDGDEIALETLIVDAFQSEDSKALYQRIFVDRNQRMALALDDALAKQQVLFVVVGAGHVIGPDGLKQYFVDKGLVVDLVESNGLFFDQNTEE